MSAPAVVFAVLAALIHVLFFVMESVLFTRPAVWPRFGLRSQEQADVVWPMAFNQGFYNLFLALGIVVGLALAAGDADSAGTALVLFACSCMAAAGVVLALTNRRFLPAAAVQVLPPLLAIVLIVF